MLDDKLYILFKEFQEKWPLERIKTMTLAEYNTVGSKDSFCYWIESRLSQWGSAWGGTSYKFGVYQYAQKPKDGDNRIQYDDRYAWYAKYKASTSEEAFEHLRSVLVDIITAVQNGNLGKIDTIKDLGHTIKWKIAFHYQNLDAPILLPIYKREWLRLLIPELKNAPTSQFYKELMSRKPTDMDIKSYEQLLGKQLWDKDPELMDEEDVPTTVEEPALEPAVANYITQHDGETYTDEQLYQIAKEMREVVGMDKNQALHLFGMLYPEQIGSKSGQIAKNALNSETLHIEIQKGIKLGKYLRSLIYNPNLLDFEVNSTDYTKYMRALRTKPFMLLAGISGTGKSRIVRELAFRSCPAELQDKDGTTPGNYLMVEVKPNWHDSSEILGYYSNISKHYQFTKFVEFLVKAHKHPETPFFVCMDEMNLAPVEQYFAEFLSVLETRKYPKDDAEHIKTGRLIEGKYMQELPDWGKNEDLTLPDNVFIIGTVNMDDTTHQFSRKVIDRAMTIEMNGEDLRKMFGGSKNMTYTEDWTLADFQPMYVQADEVVKKHGDMLKKDLPERLEAINKALAGTPFEVSYRVLNELCIYLGVLLDEHVPYQQAVKDAVDRILLMKILPRVEGDMEMFDLSKDERDAQTDKTITNKLEWLAAICKTDYPESYEKVQEMNKRLVSGFTRFWP